MIVGEEQSPQTVTGEEGRVGVVRMIVSEEQSPQTVTGEETWGDKRRGG